MTTTNYTFKKGFTIVELLIVIVIIGILAAITIVSYTGISGKAVVASIQSDLANGSRFLKMYYTDKGSYPTQMDVVAGGSFCPTPADVKYCFRPSAGNTFTYQPGVGSTPQTFSLKSTSASAISYVVTESSPIAEAPPPLSATGGTVTDAGGYRTHTFNSNGTFAVVVGGTVDIVIKGAGGGAGGPLWEDQCQFYGDPSAGGASLVTKGGTTWQANGGGRGSTVTSYCDGSGTGIDGAAGTTNSPAGWIATNGGGAAGGSKYAWGSGADWEQYGSNGGAGGKLEKIGLAVSAGESYAITVGAAGSPNGGAGTVTFKYSN